MLVDDQDTNHGKKINEIMKTLVPTILLWLITLGCLGQSDSAHRNVYFAVIEYQSGLVTKSILSDVSDSSVQLVDLTGKYIQSVSYKDIEKIRIRRKGSTGRGILIGAGTGALLGIIVGAVTYKPPEPSGWIPTYDPGPTATAAAVGVFGGLVGLITGAILGSIPAKAFKLNHDKLKFSESAPEIEKYCQAQSK
jgi:hypothetical protein